MFEFVVVDSSGRALPADRSRIRSKAALEKNKRTDSRRSRRDAKRIALSEKKAAARARLPAPPPRDLQLIPFADTMDFESQKLLHKIFTAKASQQGKHPLERSIDFTLWDSACFEWLQQDQAFLQSVLASAAMVDAANTLTNSASGNKVRYHLYRTITFLNRGLSEKDVHLKDSTLNIIITLCTTSCAVGDRAGLRAHLMGLQQIVKLRGGIEFLRRRPMLHYRINHIDLTWVLMAGEGAFFLPAFTSWKPRFFNEFPTSRLEARHPTELAVDNRLLAIFQDMQYAVGLLNQGVGKETKHTRDTFQPILDSVQSRLSQLQDQIQDTFSESIRLAMLAFHSWATNFPSVQFRATHLEARLESSWRSLGEKLSDSSRFALQFWVGVVAAGSLSRFREDRLTHRFNAAVREFVSTWHETNRRLMEVVWVEDMHDDPGEPTFRRLFRNI